MSETIFDLLALGMRYWFAALAVYILFRVIVSVWREFSRERDESRQASGSYAMGLLEVVAPADNKKVFGMRFPLRQENKIGRSSSCDIRLKDRSVAPVQALISQRGRRVFLSDYGSRKGVRLNGQRINEDVALLDGDEIRLSNVVLLLHIEGGTRRERTPIAPEDEIAYDRVSDRESTGRYIAPAPMPKTMRDAYDPDEYDVYEADDESEAYDDDYDDRDNDDYDPYDDDDDEDRYRAEAGEWDAYDYDAEEADEWEETDERARREADDQARTKGWYGASEEEWRWR